MKITTLTRRFSTLRRKNSKLNENSLKKTLSSTNIKLREDNKKSFNINNRLSAIKIDFTCLKPPEYWSSIIYHEFDNIIGNVYHCKTKSIKVNNNNSIELLNNLSNCFSIGSLINLNLTPFIKNTRQKIGNGIEFYCDGRDILATNHSLNSIFIQSKNMNYFNKSNDEFIYEIKSGVSIMIFNHSVFQELIFHYIQRDVSSVSDLLRMCIIKMSFVEGWGNNYECKNIEHTPCWIEIQLHEPMGLIASILSPAKSPIEHKKQRYSAYI